MDIFFSGGAHLYNNKLNLFPPFFPEKSSFRKRAETMFSVVHTCTIVDLCFISYTRIIWISGCIDILKRFHCDKVSETPAVFRRVSQWPGSMVCVVHPEHRHFSNGLKSYCFKWYISLVTHLYIGKVEQLSYLHLTTPKVVIKNYFNGRLFILI